MSKNNNKKQQLPPSFFKQQEQRLGVGFINKLTTETIRKNALKIFRDLATGAINPETDYQYFNVTDITYNLCEAAKDNAKYNFACYAGLSNAPEYLQDPEISKIAAAHYEHYMLYNSIAVHLNNILYNITMCNGVYTRFYLHQLVADIRWSRNVFNGYFITVSNKKTDTPYVKKERRSIPNGQGFSNQSEGGFFERPPGSNM